MEIAEKSGLINKIAKIMTPILSKLFPSIPKNHESLKINELLLNSKINVYIYIIVILLNYTKSHKTE